MALKGNLFRDSRHRPNDIFSNIASFALKGAGGDDWLKINIRHETPCIISSSIKVNSGQHVCSPERTMYDPYCIRLLRVYYVTRLRCIQH